MSRADQIMTQTWKEFENHAEFVLDFIKWFPDEMQVSIKPFVGDQHQRLMLDVWVKYKSQLVNFGITAEATWCDREQFVKGYIQPVVITLHEKAARAQSILGLIP